MKLYYVEGRDGAHVFDSLEAAKRFVHAHVKGYRESATIEEVEVEDEE